MGWIAVLLGLVVACCPSVAQAADEERAAMSRLVLTTDPKVPVGCTRLGLVRDDSIKDLRRKIVKIGGDTGLLSFPLDDMSSVQADVFRCSAVSSSTHRP
jgi:hypothetical protein